MGCLVRLPLSSLSLLPFYLSSSNHILTYISHNTLTPTRASWLTLLCRARKYTKTFDWSPLSPLLQIKARQLMKIPGVKVGNPTGNEFPLSFSAHYNPLVRTAVTLLSFILS